MEILFNDKIMTITAVGVDDDDLTLDLTTSYGANAAKLYLEMAISNADTIKLNVSLSALAQGRTEMKNYYLDKQRELFSILRDIQMNNLLNK
jgi:hypothetical protein